MAKYIYVLTNGGEAAETSTAEATDKVISSMILDVIVCKKKINK